MESETFKGRLLRPEAQLSTETEKEARLGREQTGDSPRDIDEDAVADEAASEDFTEAELTSTVLQQVREALRGIENHTFGKSLLDGRPIARKRLEVSAWTPYCLKHQKLFEAAAQEQT